MRFELILSVWKTDMLTINITDTCNECHHLKQQHSFGWYLKGFFVNDIIELTIKWTI